MLFQWKWYIYLINDILSTINCNFGYKVQNIETEIMMNCCNRGNISDKGKTVKYFLLAQLPTWSTQVGQETCFCTSHQEGMISMWKENTVADVPLQKHTIKSNLITHHLRIYSIVTDAVCTALTWPGHGLQPKQILATSSQQRMFFVFYSWPVWLLSSEISDRIQTEVKD